jgi:hypothetical protein
MSTKAPTRYRHAKPEGPPTERVIIETPPTIERLDKTRLAEAASTLAKKPVKPTPKALMELTARYPYDATHGNIDVFMPGRWDTTSNLIFMDTIWYPDPDAPYEWEGSVAYIMFKPPSEGMYLIVGNFTGWETTMHLGGPWGEATAYTATTSDSGAVTALHNGGQQFEFTLYGTQPNNLPGVGYIESIQVFELT